MVDVLTMHEDIGRLNPVWVSAHRLELGMFPIVVINVYTHNSQHSHCWQTAEGKVTSGVRAAVTQQCRCENAWDTESNWFQTLASSLPSFSPCLYLSYPSQLDFPSLSDSLCLLPTVSSPLISAFSPASLPTSRSPSPLQASEKEKESPVELTERCFRELLGRAAYGNIKNAVTPVLMWDTLPIFSLRFLLWCTCQFFFLTYWLNLKEGNTSARF